MINDAAKTVWRVKIHIVLSCCGVIESVLKFEFCVVAVCIEFYNLISNAVTTDEVSESLFSSLGLIDITEVVVNVLVN